jgi:endoglucanase
MLASIPADKTPVFVAYNIPGRDCGQYSSGGTASSDSYKTWINGLAAGIGSRKAAVILEPDALAMLGCLGSAEKVSRLELLGYAVSKLGSNPSTAVYLDAGHSNWHSPAEMASRLNQAGIANARGFSTNVSNYNATLNEVTYGTAISALTGGKKFIIDTSRNGSGPGDTWCNPSGRSLGPAPTAVTGNPLIDAYFWVKVPGESDGSCNGGPSAGQWWSDYALGLAKRAAY